MRQFIAGKEGLKWTKTADRAGSARPGRRPDHQFALTLKMKPSTSRFRVSACCERSTAASRASLAMRPVSEDVEVIWTMWSETSSVPRAASWTLLEMSCVALRCCEVSTSIPDMIALISAMVFEMASIACAGVAGNALDARDLRGDFFGRLAGLMGEILHLGGDHRKSLAGLAGPRRFDRGIQRQEVGLRGDRLHQLNHGADLFGGFRQRVNGVAAFARLARGAFGALRGIA